MTNELKLGCASSHDDGDPDVIESGDLKRLESAVARVMNRGGDLEQLSRVAEVPIDVVRAAMADPLTAARLLDAQADAEDRGDLLRPVAARITLAMLEKLDEALAAGELDVDDIGNLLPKVHRVVEHADRIEAGRGNGDDDLPVFHIQLISGAITRVEPMPTPMVFEVQPGEGQD